MDASTSDSRPRRAPNDTGPEDEEDSQWGDALVPDFDPLLSEANRAAEGLVDDEALSPGMLTVKLV